MTARIAALAALVWLGLAPASNAQIFRAGTDTVYLSVTVVDGKNRLVGGLDQDAFAVREDGLLQDVRVFSRAQQPIALSILLDSSTSMDPSLETAQAAASGFASRLGPRDVAQIISFAESTEILQEFTADRALLDEAIQRILARGSTSLYEALYVALSEQRKIRARTSEELRRQAIVLLSDGEDTSSLVDYEQVLDLSKRSEVTVYAIGLREGLRQPGRYSEADFVLRTLSRETGGRVFFVEDAGALPAIYEQIATELANQYTIGYTSNNERRDGGWRVIQVDVDQPGAVARTRSGYFGPKSER